MNLRHGLIVTVLAALLVGDAAMAEVFRADRLLLTWQRDPATTMTVQWLVAAEAPPEPVTLAYWPSDEPGERHEAVTSVKPIQGWPDKFIHRVELTGLAPDTAYRFQAVGHDEDYGFVTMPATLDEPLVFAAGGDTRHRQDWMERVNRVAMAHEPRFIVWGGDLAYADGLEERLYRWQEWFDANYNTLIDDEGYVMPIVVAIGNHEVQSGSWREHEGYEQTDAWRQRIASYFFQLFAFPGQPGYNVLDFGDYMSVIVLDTEHANPIRGAQTDWLAEVLAERREVPHVLPVYHWPAFPSHRQYDHWNFPTRIRAEWVPLFERYGVRLAFENHDHTYKRTPPIRAEQIDAEAGIVYVGDGAWGVSTRPVHDPAETWFLERAESVRHCLIVTLDGVSQRVEAYDEHGELLDAFETRKPAPAPGEQ